MDQAASPLTVDIVSDVVCPWCYIGKRHLERALADLGRAGDAIVRWHPFELNPDLPSEGIDRKRYVEAKFGGA
jgi:predicted DsbA family dithiol-disulfide isomerase